MKKFIVKLVFSVETETRSVEQVDEQWRIINATDTNLAKLKAKEIGASESETLKRNDGEHITWQYITTTDIIEIGNLRDGETIFSFTPEVEDARAYINQVALRSGAEIG